MNKLWNITTANRIVDVIANVVFSLFNFILFYFLDFQKFGFAISDFLSTLKLDNSQPDAFHLVGVSFFHQGKLRVS